MAEYVTTTNNYTISTSTDTTTTATINYSDLYNLYYTAFPTTQSNSGTISKEKKEKIIDPRLIKADQEIAELREKTVFYSIKEYVPNKVYSFTFSPSPIYQKQKQNIKTICSEEDIFDLEFAFRLAYCKYYCPDLTLEGQLRQAEELKFHKLKMKQIKNGIKLFHKLQEKEAIEEQIKAEKKHRHDKLVRKKKEKREREKQNQIDIIKTAIKDSK